VTWEEIVPARDTRKTKYTMKYIKWTSKLIFISLILVVNKNIYQQ
jgi:hypothetical protein